MNIREILDSIAEEEPEELVAEEDARRMEEIKSTIVVELERQLPRVKKTAPLQRTELDSVQAMRSFDSFELRDCLEYLGEYYFAARAEQTNIWAPEDDVNWIDLIWLKVAWKHLHDNPTGPGERLLSSDRLIVGLRRCLSIQGFGTECLRHMDLTLLRNRLRGFWLVMDSEKEPAKVTELTRLCTRFISAVAYVRTHVIGEREVRVISRHKAEDAQLLAALDGLLQFRAQQLPEQVYDAMQEVITTCLMPADAATHYDMQSRTLGIHAGNSRDVASVVTTCDEMNVGLCAEFCEFVPWERPGKPMMKIPAEHKWLWEVWQLNVFAFMFHSAHCSQSGAWASAAENVLEAGLFSVRYLVTWWALMQPHGLKKLLYQKRYHVKALPLVIQAGNDSWWVRTEREILVCSSLGSALRQWLCEVRDQSGGNMEDCVPVSVETFCKGLAPPPPSSVDVSVPSSPNSNSTMLMADSSMSVEAS